MLSLIRPFILTALLFVTVFNTKAQEVQNWSAKQLMEPSQLAATIRENKNIPLIYSIGPGAIIPKSIAIGMVNEASGLNKLKQQLASVRRDQKLVIYCGCCPFEHCPNVRPAIDLLKKMQFTNYFLLNIPQNMKRDWIDKGYPVIK